MKIYQAVSNWGKRHEYTFLIEKPSGKYTKRGFFYEISSVNTEGDNLIIELDNPTED